MIWFGGAKIQLSFHILRFSFNSFTNSDFKFFRKLASILSLRYMSAASK